MDDDDTSRLYQITEDEWHELMYSLIRIEWRVRDLRNMLDLGVSVIAFLGVFIAAKAYFGANLVVSWSAGAWVVVGVGGVVFLVVSAVLRHLVVYRDQDAELHIDKRIRGELARRAR